MRHVGNGLPAGPVHGRQLVVVLQLGPIAAALDLCEPNLVPIDDVDAPDSIDMYSARPAPFRSCQSLGIGWFGGDDKDHFVVVAIRPSPTGRPWKAANRYIRSRQAYMMSGCQS